MPLRHAKSLAAYSTARATSRRRSDVSGSERLLTWLVLFASLLTASAAEAHVGHTSRCVARSVAGGLQVELEVPFALIRAPSEPLEDVEGHVRASTPAGDCSLAARGPTPGQGPSLRHFTLDFACPEGPVTFSTDFGMDSDTGAEVVCTIDRHPFVFRPGALDYVVGTPPRLLQALTGFVELGIVHVATGADHLLFVLSLLFGAARTPLPTTKRRLGRIALVVTGFTLGHSITLVAAGLGVVSLPSRLTESLIALSIALVAVHNLLEKNPRGRLVTSALFGLIHGFGFASALRQMGLPRQGAVACLLSFNVGIELGQLLLVLACFPALLWAQRRRWFERWLFVPACAAVACAGLLWFVERALGFS
jgi:hypothetical protein